MYLSSFSKKSDAKIYIECLIFRLINDLKKFYGKVEIKKPASSRKESSEIYVLATKFAIKIPDS